MKKDAYYFSHDANSQDDPKCMILIDQLGMEGYGIFWALIEKLRNEKDFKLPLLVLNSLAKRWSTSKEKVEAVVKSYSLFIIEDDNFFSLRLQRSMEEKSEKARVSAGYRWEEHNKMRSHNDRITNVMRNDAIKGKERKGKESKMSKEKKEHAIACTYEQVEIESFNNFQKWLNENAPRVNELKYPLTISEYLVVSRKIPKEVLKKVLIAMQNRADLLKKYVSAYLTILNWSEREAVGNQIIPGFTEKNPLNEKLKAAVNVR